MSRNPFFTAADAALTRSTPGWLAPYPNLAFRPSSDGDLIGSQTVFLSQSPSIGFVPINLTGGETVPLFGAVLSTYTPSIAIFDSAGYLMLFQDGGSAIEGPREDTIVNFTPPRSGTYYISVYWEFVQGATGTVGVGAVLSPWATRPTTLFGTADPDFIRGESLPETILGGFGADRLWGNGGNDWIDGDAGDDTIYGGAGDDSIRGLDDNDWIDGGDGVDDVNGNMGRDTVHGGAGDDAWVRGGQGDDVVYGGLGNDRHVNGNIGNDTVYGDDGNDAVFGGQGDDLLYGGTGNDTVSGDLGNDTLWGGAGADRFVFNPNGGVDRIMDFNAAEGDRIQLAAGTTWTISTAPGGEALVTLSTGTSFTMAGIVPAAVAADWFVLG